jgi:hypothetical protein
MTLDPKEAAASLDDIAAIERRTRETLYYGRVADVFLLWGVLTVGGHLLNWFVPSSLAWAWPIIDVGGFIATVAIVAWKFPAMRRGGGVGWRWIGSYLSVLAFGAIVTIELSPLTARQQQVFWPTLVMFSYVLAGFWVGRFFLYLGLVVIALVLIGYYLSGAWFTLWLAFVFGGGLIAGALWLRWSA